MREKIALKVVKAIYMDRDSSQPMTDISLDIADQILSLPVEGFEVKVQTSDHPNGYAIETRPLTLGELLKKAPILIKIAQWANDENDKDCIEFFNCPADESWCKESNCPIDDALTFNGSRIVKKPIPSSDGK
jgi:hypothetical protein